MLQSERLDFLKAYYCQPSIGIQGICSGYREQEVKTIISSQASAKMEVRLVLGLDPEFVFEYI